MTHDSTNIRAVSSTPSCAGKLFMAPTHNSDVVNLLLRTASGNPLLLDFGQPLTAPPGGLKPNQAVDVVATVDPGTFGTPSLSPLPGTEQALFETCEPPRAAGTCACRHCGQSQHV